MPTTHILEIKCYYKTGEPLTDFLKICINDGTVSGYFVLPKERPFFEFTLDINAVNAKCERIRTLPGCNLPPPSPYTLFSFKEIDERGEKLSTGSYILTAEHENTNDITLWIHSLIQQGKSVAEYCS